MGHQVVIGSRDDQALGALAATRDSKAFGRALRERLARGRTIRLLVVTVRGTNVINIFDGPDSGDRALNHVVTVFRRYFPRRKVCPLLWGDTFAVFLRDGEAMDEPLLLRLRRDLNDSSTLATRAPSGAIPEYLREARAQVLAGYVSLTVDAGLDLAAAATVGEEAVGKALARPTDWLHAEVFARNEPTSG